MPYTDADDRRHVDATGLCYFKGDLTYLHCQNSIKYINLNGKSYQVISDAIAALEDAAHELRRRVLDPYEDTKILANGDLEWP